MDRNEANPTKSKGNTGHQKRKSKEKQVQAKTLTSEDRISEQNPVPKNTSEPKKKIKPQKEKPKEKKRKSARLQDQYGQNEHLAKKNKKVIHIEETDEEVPESENLPTSQIAVQTDCIPQPEQTPNPPAPAKSTPDVQQPENSLSPVESTHNLQMSVGGKRSKKNFDWKKSIDGRPVICERQIVETPANPHITTVCGVLKELGLEKWLNKIPGYVLGWVQEFYTTLEVKGKGERMTARVRGKSIIITIERIAVFLGCPQLEKKEVEYPKIGYTSPEGEELAAQVCTEAGMKMFLDKNQGFKQGMLKEECALINKIIHFNLRPKGSEKSPTLLEVQLVYEIMQKKKIDIAHEIYTVIREFKAKTSLRGGLPYVSMISMFCKESGVKLGEKEKWKKPAYGVIGMKTINKMLPQRLRHEQPQFQTPSRAETLYPFHAESSNKKTYQTRSAEATPPPSQETSQNWLEIKEILRTMMIQQNEDSQKLNALVEQQKLDSNRLMQMEGRQKEHTTRLSYISEQQSNILRSIEHLNKRQDGMEKGGGLVLENMKQSEIREQCLVMAMKGLIDWARGGLPPSNAMFPTPPTILPAPKPQSAQPTQKFSTAHAAQRAHTTPIFQTVHLMKPETEGTSDGKKKTKTRGGKRG